MRTSVLEYDLKGWSVTYSVPIKDKNERIEKTAYFYDKAVRKTENNSEKPNNCEVSEIPTGSETQTETSTNDEKLQSGVELKQTEQTDCP